MDAATRLQDMQRTEKTGEQPWEGKQQISYCGQVDRLNASSSSTDKLLGETEGRGAELTGNL